jgi:hypothetical protein
MDSKARIRLIASLSAMALSVDGSVVSIEPFKVGLKLPGKTPGICSIDLSGCEFSFGADDIPLSEAALPGLRLDAGVSIINSEGESLWLIEILDKLL